MLLQTTPRRSYGKGSSIFHTLAHTNVQYVDGLGHRCLTAKLVCKFERIFPPSYFDGQIHLLVHLVCEISIVGPMIVLSKGVLDGVSYGIFEIINAHLCTIGRRYCKEMSY